MRVVVGAWVVLAGRVVVSWLSVAEVVALVVVSVGRPRLHEQELSQLLLSK